MKERRSCISTTNNTAKLSAALVLGAMVPFLAYAQITYPEEGCAVRYSYDDAGNQTTREWYCWTSDPTESPVQNEKPTALENNSLRIFPNPANDQARVVLEKEIEQGTLTVNDASGKQLLSEPFTGSAWTVNVADFSPGLYWAVVTKGEERLMSNFRVDH